MNLIYSSMGVISNLDLDTLFFHIGNSSHPLPKFYFFLKFSISILACDSCQEKILSPICEPYSTNPPTNYRFRLQPTRSIFFPLAILYFLFVLVELDSYGTNHQTHLLSGCRCCFPTRNPMLQSPLLWRTYLLDCRRRVGFLYQNSRGHIFQWPAL